MFARLPMLAAVLLAGCTPADAQQALPAGPPVTAILDQCEDKDGWSDPAPPVRIFGNVYDVGTCGIVVCGLGVDGIAYVLADCSAVGLGPEGWARKVAAAAEAWRAHRVIAEANNGGKIVESVLRGAEAGLPVTLVHAADGKAARAEPVMVAFENGRARLAGRFPELEDEMCGLIQGGDYRGPGPSPDRADAMVWAMTELVVKPQRAEPRIRAL